MDETKVSCPACNGNISLDPLGAVNPRGQRVMQWHIGINGKECPGSSRSTEATLRLVPNRTCLACGARDGDWTAERRPEVEVRLNRLAKNQVVGSGHPDTGHILFTHNCKKK